MSITTTENLGDKPFVCDWCKQTVAIIVEKPGRKYSCIDCLPEREKAVYEGDVVEEWVEDED